MVVRGNHNIYNHAGNSYIKPDGPCYPGNFPVTRNIVLKTAQQGEQHQRYYDSSQYNMRKQQEIVNVTDASQHCLLCRIKRTIMIQVAKAGFRSQ